jgi:hypothetical protein
MENFTSVYTTLLQDVGTFAQLGSERKLRGYQECVAKSIVEAVIWHPGTSFVVIFPRQSGKNELQAQIECYLLTLFSQFDAEIVKVSPTWKPQSLNAMRRLERVLKRNLISRYLWKKEQGYIYKVGSARIFFLSGSPTANIVGATASTLLECDEAQDVLLSKWDKDINPMAASTNATRVFWGTAWTSRTLLAREKRAALEAEAADGRQRVFQITADDVSREVPAYGEFVAGEIAKLGRNHPFIRTQFFCEEIDSEGGMFPPARVAMMGGVHPRQVAPSPRKDPRGVYAILIDVAGEDETALENDEDGDNIALANAGRDATVLTVVEVDISTVSDELIKAPTYRVLDRAAWIGTKHTARYGRIKAYIEMWGPRWVVIDATGVGAGMASFLASAYGEKVIPFVFTSKSKSDLGWGFLATIETGRFKDWEREEIRQQGNDREEHTLQATRKSIQPQEQETFYNQLAYCQMEIIPGPERKMKWGVPDGTRDARNGELVHDDFVLSAALVAVLDQQEWSISTAPLVVKRADPLLEMDQEESHHKAHRERKEAF